MRRITKRWRGIWITCLLLVAMLAVFGHFSADSRQLLNVAVPAATVGDWLIQDASIPNFVRYYWLPDQNVLFFRLGEAGGYRAYRQHIAFGGMAMLPTVLPMSEITPNLNVQSLSPDGRWLCG